MAYRKAYYRKDGTYVSSSFDSRNSRRSKSSSNNNNDSRGCFLIIGYIVFFAFARDIIFNDHAWYWKLFFGIISLLLFAPIISKINKAYKNFKSKKTNQIGNENT